MVPTSSVYSHGNPWIFRITAIVGLLLALGYLQTAWVLITQHQVTFIDYTATTPQAQWVVANLGARLTGIAVGFLVAVWLRNRHLLALMFVVRLVADLSDFLISATTAGVAPSVPLALGIFVAIEASCLWCLHRAINTERPAP